VSIKAMKWAYGLFEVIDIPPAERAVLLALCWDHTEAKGCYPSQERVSLLSGYRRQRVNEAVKKLDEWGLIKKRTTRSGGKFAQTSYTLFCNPKASPRPHGGTRHRVQKKGHGHRAQTGGQYRGTNNRDRDCEIIEFPNEKVGGGS